MNNALAIRQVGKAIKADNVYDCSESRQSDVQMVIHIVIKVTIHIDFGPGGGFI